MIYGFHDSNEMQVRWKKWIKYLREEVMDEHNFGGVNDTIQNIAAEEGA